MSNEKFFRMLSIALLGGIALACVPDSQASSAAVLINGSITESINMDASVPVEIEVVREVDEINAGRFNPALAGDVKEATDIVSLTQFDPNL